MNEERKKVVLVYGVTGGRHPQMLGLATAINAQLEEEGFEVVAHMGFSGGALVAALMARGVHQEPEGSQGWLMRSAEVTRYGKIGGIPQIFRNMYNLFRYGGLLASKSLYEKVFKNIIPGRLNVPAYVGSWCVSHRVEVLFELTEESMAKSVLCSAALPFAISSVERSNEELLALGEELLAHPRLDRGHGALPL